MRNLIFSIISLCCATGAVAQVNEPDSTLTEQVTEILIVPDSEDNDGQNILDAVMLDQQPQFPGGIDGLMNFLMQNVTYPAECAEAEIQGKVMVKFVVQKNGSIGDVEITKSVHPILDAEAIRVVKSMPNWTPGTLDGNPVNVWFSLPVNFKLQGGASSTPVLSERDQADYDNFMRLGNEALAAGNTNHAYQYYKECFNIKPWELSLIDRIDSLLSNQTDIRDQFYDWTVKRLYREMESGNNFDGLIPHMVSLQERLVESHPNDLYTLGLMQEIYFHAKEYDKIILISDKIYPLMPKEQIGLLSNVLTKHAYALSHKENNTGIINLIAPHIDELLTQPTETANTLPFLALLDAYFQTNDKKGAKQLLIKFKQAFPSFYAEDIDLFLQDEPELKSFVEDALK